MGPWVKPLAGEKPFADAEAAGLHFRREGNGKRLFTPNAGTTPPALAGQEQEQKLLGKGAVLRLKQGKPKQTSIE